MTTLESQPLPAYCCLRIIWRMGILVSTSRGTSGRRTGITPSANMSTLPAGHHGTMSHTQWRHSRNFGSCIQQVLHALP